MAKKNQNTATTYFTQKERPKLEGTLLALGVIGMAECFICYLIDYWWYGAIGLYIGGSAIIAYIILTAKKVTDDTYDAHVNEFIEKNLLLPTAKHYERLYDCERGHIKLGRDRKLRSSVYCISEFEFKRETCDLTLTEIDFCASEEGAPIFTQKKHSFPVGTEFSIVESEITVSETKRKLTHLKLNTEHESIKLPIDPNSCDTDEIIAKIRGKR